MNHSPEYQLSELPAIELFKKLGYHYYNGAKVDERNDITEVVLIDRLLKSIKRLNPLLNENNVQKAFDKATSVTGSSLMEINQNIWEIINGDSISLKQVIDDTEQFIPVKYIDYTLPDNNDFLVVNQMRFHGLSQHSVPDLVVYINGLPIAVIEAKSPTAQNAWDKAYTDLDYYQKNSEKLFHYTQLCVGIWKDGARYGAINSPQQFYSVFKTTKDDDVELLGTEPSEQDILLYSIFNKNTVLDIIRHFVLFELDEGRTIKKLPRYQQLRATNNTIAKLQAGEGGVVWHTQGSGKSLTMAYITRKLQAPEYGFDNPTVIVMTDRKDLDRQITGTFRNVGFKNVHQAVSVAHLDKLLRNDYGGIITTTLQKFQETDRDSTQSIDQTELDEKPNIRIEKHIDGTKLVKITKEYINGKWVIVSKDEVELEELSSKENIIILVDEAHRSHYGFLASFMRTVLPNALFVAFTGTPISKDDKSTLGEFYGGDYIDVYTIKQAVADGATVELLYDEGIARLDIKKDELDKEFEEKFGNESEEKKDKLKREALKKYQLSSSRINEITKHIVNNFRDKIFPDGHKAMIVCSGRHQAIKYQQSLHELKQQGYHNFESKVVVSIGSPKTDAIAKEYYETIRWNQDHPDDIRPTWVTAPEDVKTVSEDYKLPFGDVSTTEKSGKKKFDNTALLIVSDMFLTGYDAPIASCLYLDKPLKEHNLLQAIARVNRSREGKSAGFIVDYNGITAYLIDALEIFSGDIRPDDILKNINEEFPKLELNHNKLVLFFRPMVVDRNYERERYIDKAIQYIEPMDRRDEFKSLLKDFNKSVNIVLPNTKAIKFEKDFRLYNELKLRAKNTYPDDDGLKISKDESKMLQQMIDDHLKSNAVENLLAEPISIIDKDKFKEDILSASPATKELKMRNNLKYTIKTGIDKNPDFYKPLAERLEQLLKDRDAERITQLDLLKEYEKIQDVMIAEQKEGEEKGFTTPRQRAVYDSMKTIFDDDDDAESATHDLFEAIEGELNIIDWVNKGQVKKDIEIKIMRFLKKKLSRNDAKTKSKEIVEVLVKNNTPPTYNI